MQFHRRNILIALAGVSAGPFARAQQWPSRPVHLVVGQAAGSSPDTTARLIAQFLSDRLGQPFIVENKPGAGQNIGAEAVIRSAADGYTLLFSTAANASNASLYDNLSFNFVRDTTPISGVGRVPNVMVVNPKIPARDLREFIAHAKANPGKVNMASSGNGTSPHLAGELFQSIAGVKMTHVPYRGSSPALTDLVSGQVDVMFDVLGSSLALIKEGKLRALGLTTTTRAPALPDIPAIAEQLPGFEVSSWSGLVGPAGLAGDIVTKLNQAATAALADTRLIARLSDLGTSPMPMAPTEFGKFIADETEKWAKVVKSANVKPD